MDVRLLAGAPRLAPLYGRALLGARKSGGQLPGRELVRDGVTVDRDHLAAYARVCGFDLSDALPLTYPHVLGFGMQLELMTSHDFGFPLLGLVHLANTFTRSRQITAGEKLMLRVRAGQPGQHRRGTTFVLTTEARVGDESVWTGRSTYLYRDGSRSGHRAGHPPALETAPTARWHLPEDTGRRYADVSGDRNPIHLHWLTARPFGFSGPIAHGMDTAARCLATLGPRVPAATTVEVEFGAPLPLPSSVDFHAWPDGRFAVHGKRGRRHLAGTLR